MKKNQWKKTRRKQSDISFQSSFVKDYFLKVAVTQERTKENIEDLTTKKLKTSVHEKQLKYKDKQQTEKMFAGNMTRVNALIKQREYANRWEKH